MKALKILGRIILTVFFIVLIACIIVVLTYTLNQPDTVGEQRSIISGPWVEIVGEDEEAQQMTFSFNQAGEFTILEGEKQIADGYFKIDEDESKVKLLMIPGHYTAEFEKYVKYKVFAEISYSKLNFELDDNDEIIEDDPPTVTFLIRTNDGSNKSAIYDCQMNEVTIDLYNSENDLTKDA